MKVRTGSVFWGYFVELVLTGALGLVAWWLWGLPAIHAFIKETASEWAGLTGTLFAASLAVWLTFVNIRASEFGDYLQKNEAVGVYSAAFITALVVHLAATICLIAAKGSQNIVVALVAAVLMLYGGVNVVTLVCNASGLVALYGTFRRMLREAQAEPQTAEAESEESDVS